MSKKTDLLAVEKEILGCKTCLRLAKGKIVPGEGDPKSKIVFVGEAPGKEEIKTGKPFVGRAGKILRDLLDSVGLNAERVFITSAVKYLPKSYITPKPADIIHGRKHLQKQLEIIKPDIIVILGNTAANSLLDRKLSISRDHGKIFLENEQKYFLSYHPAAPLYSPKLREVVFNDFKKLQKLIF